MFGKACENMVFYIEPGFKPELLTGTLPESFCDPDLNCLDLYESKKDRLSILTSYSWVSYTDWPLQELHNSIIYPEIHSSF